MVCQVGGHGLRDTPAKGRRGADGVDAEAQEAGAEPFPYRESFTSNVKGFAHALYCRLCTLTVCHCCQ